MAHPIPKALLSGPSTKPLRVASVGECMVELAPAPIAGQYQRAFAGDTLNTLWYLRQLRPDWVSRYVSRIGEDAVSDGMLAMMQGAGINVDHVQRDGERTVGLYMISLSDGERSFAYWRGQSAAKRMADDPDVIALAIQDVDVVFFSGVTLAILEDASRAHLLHALATARAQGKTVAFDPNLRPRLWPGSVQMQHAIMQGAAVADIVLPSFDEEAAHFGDNTIQATAARYVSAGARTVVVKNGAEAVHFVDRRHSGMVLPIAAKKVVDTTSAGDSFNAGILAGLGKYSSMEEAIELACGVATQVIGRRGALVTLDLSALGAEVKA